MRIEASREREQLRITLDSIGDALIVTDAEGRITTMNPVAESLTGWSGERGGWIASALGLFGSSTRRPGGRWTTRFSRC